MIGRVTQGYIVNDFNSSLHTRQEDLQKVEKQLATGYRVNLASDDPVAAINFMSYDSRLKEISTYNTIIDNAKSRINLTDSALNSATTVIQRMRELAVQAANGTYSKEERQNMAVEVDQLTRELIQVANTDYKGNPVFSGTMREPNPFKSNIQTDKDTGIEFVQDVKYFGNSQSQIAEVDNGERVEVAQAGNQVFWAENMEINSTMNVSGYTASTDSKMVIDGVPIEIKTGDNVEIIANKINNSGAPVKASVITNNGRSYFTLETTSPHQMALADDEGGSVLQDIGLIDHGMFPPDNYSPSARVYTGSIFDTMINFRKALQRDDIFKIGGTALEGIDSSLSNILKYRAHAGSISQRLDTISERFSNDEVYLADAKETSTGTDISKAMIDLKMLEFSHDVALNVGARLLPKTLLDFLR